MSTAPTRSGVLKGLRAGLPFLVVILPFGLLFGVLSAEAGLRLPETLAMAGLVIAGASQFTALALMQDHAPTLVIILTALAVNLRLALYSAALTPHLGQAPLHLRALIAYTITDQTFGAALAAYERDPGQSLGDRLGFWIGASLMICLPWLAVSCAGALAGTAIPPDYGLDFAVPVTFIALFAPMLRSLPHLAAAFTSVLAALGFAALPWSTGLLAAALLAMMAGAETERQLARRNRP